MDKEGLKESESKQKKQKEKPARKSTKHQLDAQAISIIESMEV